MYIIETACGTRVRSSHTPHMIGWEKSRDRLNGILYESVWPHDYPAENPSLNTRRISAGTTAKMRADFSHGCANINDGLRQKFG